MLSLVLHETEVLLVAESIDSRIDELCALLAISTDSEFSEHYKCELSALRALYDKIKYSK